MHSCALIPDKSILIIYTEPLSGFLWQFIHSTNKLETI